MDGGCGGRDRPDLAGVTTPVNPPHHSDTGFYCLPCKKVSRGGLTHDACSPVRVVGADRVRGPLTHRLHPGKMQSMGSPLTLGLKACGPMPSLLGKQPRDRRTNHVDRPPARAWLLRAELAKSAVENLRVHMDLRANQAKNRNSLVRKINIAPAQG